MNKKEFDKQYDESIEDVINRSSELSGKVSSLGLYIVGGILATNWTIMYRKDGLEIINNWLLSAAILCFVYLALSLCFYFNDSVFYHKKSIELFKNQGNSKYLEKHKEMMTEHSSFSYILYYIKFGLLVITAFIFIIGMFKLIK